LLSYWIGHYMESGVWEWTANSADGMTMAFLTMSMTEIFHAFNSRSIRRSIFSLKKQNLWLWGAMGLSLLLTTAVIYIPFLKTAFAFEAISFAEYLVALGLGLLVIPFVELTKAIGRIGKK
ncbi:MAG: cation transporting ATPase C-terminal domain-containing protein, partial [Christensenellaceae bacterium]